MDVMQHVTWGLVLMMALNFGISCWNAYVVGRSWPYIQAANHKGLWLVGWAGHLMAAAGFSWCALIPLSLVTLSHGWAGYDEHAFKVTMELGYLTIGSVVISTGAILWVHSLVMAFRTRSFGDLAAAGWNTYAQISNTVNFIENAEPFYKDVIEFFGSVAGDSDSEGDNVSAWLVGLVVALVIGSSLVGLVLAAMISQYAQRRSALEMREKSDS